MTEMLTALRAELRRQAEEGKAGAPYVIELEIEEPGGSPPAECDDGLESGSKLNG